MNSPDLNDPAVMVVLVGRPLRAVSPEDQSTYTLVRQRAGLIKLPIEALELLRHLLLPRRGVDVKQWLVERGVEPTHQLLHRLIDLEVVWTYGTDKRDDVAALNRLLVVPAGTTQYPATDASGRHQILVAGRTLSLPPPLYLLWLYSYGRSITQIAPDIARQLGMPVERVLECILEQLPQLLGGGAARLDSV